MGEIISEAKPRKRTVRTCIVRCFGVVEDITYIGLGILLATMALALLVLTTLEIIHNFNDGTIASRITPLLDRVLLTLLIVELLYTVQVSFREHALTPEPFLLVGLIAAVRRMLLLTAEYGELHDKTADALRGFAIELLVLTVLIVALVVALLLLRRAGAIIRAERG